MNLMEQLAAEKKAAQELIAKGGENLTADEQKQLKDHYAAAKELNDRITTFKEANEFLNGDNEPNHNKVDMKTAPTLGDHYLREAEAKGGVTAIKNAQIIASEWKAASDTHTAGSGRTTDTGYQPFQTVLDRDGVWPYERPLVIADLFDAGTIEGTTIEYPVYGALEGNATTVAEGAAKPQVHLPEPTWVTDSLSEIAAWWKITDNMAEDLPFIVSEINSHAQYNLRLQEEVQLLSGDGSGSNIKGLFNREIQTMAQDTDSDPDRLFKATTKIATATGFAADAIVMNPADYETIRLSRDSNGQYYGGGYFTGQYGNGGVMQNPPIWGLRTVVTEAMTQGTALVGAFRLGGKVFRKGGLRVDSTNSHDTDFTSDKITFRIRERLGLQVKYPKAFVKVTLGKE